MMRDAQRIEHMLNFVRRSLGMRNVLTHEYFRVKPTILFETVTSQFKLLEHQLEELQIEYP